MSDILNDEEKALARSRPIEAIKAYRNRTGSLLIDAKNVVEDYMGKEGILYGGAHPAKVERGISKPLVHLNGTALATLREQYETAAHAVRAAVGALDMAAPHARDYYPQRDPTAFRRAVAEYTARREKLTSVLSDLEEIVQHLAEIPKRPGEPE